MSKKTQNHIQFEDSRGFEEWYRYDDQGNIIYSKDSNDYEEWCEYDDQGNMIYLKNSNGFVFDQRQV